MSLEHTRLQEAALSPAALKAVSGPMKPMAARGMAPIADPADLLTVLYQLALDPDASIRQAAAKSASELPEKLLAGGLADTALDPRVLDFFALQHLGRPELIQIALLNGATADATVATLAGRVGVELIDLIAQNEQRMLRHPAIIGAMYTNPQARMSTVDRAVELAVRNQIRVPGIPAWDEIVKAVLGSKGPAQDAATADAMFARYAGQAGGEIREVTDEELAQKDRGLDELPISKMSVPMKIRLATLGGSATRAQLIRDPMKLVALAAIKAPGVNEMEAAKYAGNHSLCDEVIAHIANRREWTKLYGVKLSLVQNPKTPIPAAVRFMQHLREKDLRVIARSKGVPSAISANARKLLMARQRLGGKR